MADLTDPLVGTVLVEKFQIQKKIGEGGMGAIYVARHVVLEKIVALKVMHEEYTRRAELVERFLHEAKAAARIRHDNVVDIYDFGRTPAGAVFMAMELLEGKDLHDVLHKEGPLPWPRAKRIVLQICAALQAAHESGIIHRDLKPENVFLTTRLGKSDFVKILDFGIAKLTDLEQAGRNLTKTGMVFGTPEYMAPEQARGEKADLRADVYATGCILYEVLAGWAPYRADTFMGVLTKHLFDPVPQLAELKNRTDVPPGLQAVLEQTLAKPREKRFASMNELAVALDTLDPSEKPAPKPAPPPPQETLPPPVFVEASSPPAAASVQPAPTETVSRRPVALWAVGGLAILGVVALIVWLKSSSPPPTIEATTAPAPAAAPAPAPAPAPVAAPVAAPAPVPAPASAPVPAPPRRKRPPPPTKTASRPRSASPSPSPSAAPAVDKRTDLKDPFPGQ